MATLPSISNVASAISSGNFSSALATATGGASSIVTSLNGMSASIPKLPSLPSIPGLPNISGLPSVPGLPTIDTLRNIKPPEITGLSGLADATKGISSSAFTAISNSFKPLQAGVPQNLTIINLKNKLEQVATDTKAASTPLTTSFASGLNSAGVDVVTGKIPEVEAAVASGGVKAGLSALSGAMSNVPGMSGIISPSALASGVSNLPGGQSALSSIVNPSSLTTSGISDTLSGLGSITKNASSAALNQISTATSSSSSLSGLLSGNALTGAGSSLSGVLSNPSNPLNGVTGNNIPNVSELPSISNLTQGLQSGKQPLSSLVSTGLSPAAAASLTASMNSLSTASPFPIKMPTVAENTINRSEISSQISNLLGDKKVPAPNFSGLAATPMRDLSQSEIAAYDENKKEIETLSESRFALVKAEADARYTLSKAKQDLPQGDPSIPALEQAVETANNKINDLDKRVTNLQNTQYTLTTGKPSPSSTITSA